LGVVLSAVALVFPFLAGYGLAAPFRRDERPLSTLETVTASMLTGLVFLSVLSFVMSLIVGGAVQQWTIAAICVALGALGLLVRRRNGESPLGILPSITARGRGLLVEGALGLLIVGELLFFAARSLQTGLGWDGLVVWNMKSRFLCINNFMIDPQYFSDPTRQWAHPSYPFFSPFLQTWLYHWVGQCDQGIVKILPPIYFALCLAVIYIGSRRLGAPHRAAMLLTSAVFFIPQVLNGEGGPTSGYSDFPLGVFYLASVVYTFDYIETRSRRAACIAALSMMALPWIKQEGMILMGTVAVVLALFAIQRRQVVVPVLMLVPGVALAGAWRLFVQSVGTPPSVVFLAMTPQTVLTNIPRIADILPAVVHELTMPSHWSVLWIAAIGVLVFHQSSRCYVRRVSLPIAIILPLALDSSSYIFSAWVPFMAHLDSSISRLVLQVMPCAFVAIGSVMSTCACEVGREETYEPLPDDSLAPRTAIERELVGSHSSSSASA
jgi:hypothetical protein